MLLEDDPNDAELITHTLAKDGLDVDWRHVMSEADFREALAGPPPDLVLADYTLPGFDGLGGAEDPAPDASGHHPSSSCPARSAKSAPSKR